jgi:hypothetical protein
MIAQRFEEQLREAESNANMLRDLLLNGVRETSKEMVDVEHVEQRAGD